MGKSKDEILSVGYVYKLSSLDGKLIYYGSTNNYTERFRSHKKDYNRFLKGKHSYVSNFEIIKLGNYNKEVVATLYNISRFDLERKEREFVENNPCENLLLPGRDMTSIKCSICSGTYSEKTKSRHENGQKHIAALQQKPVFGFCCKVCNRDLINNNPSTITRHEKTLVHLKALQNQVNTLSNQINNLTNVIKKIKLKPKQPITIGNNNSNITINSNNL